MTRVPAAAGAGALRVNSRQRRTCRSDLELRDHCWMHLSDFDQSSGLWPIFIRCPSACSPPLASVPGISPFVPRSVPLDQQRFNLGLPIASVSPCPGFTASI